MIEYADILEAESADAGKCPCCGDDIDSGRCTCTPEEQEDGPQGCTCPISAEFCTC